MDLAVIICVLAILTVTNGDCDNYECVSENKVRMLGSVLDCPKGKLCNSKQTGQSCTPCVGGLCVGVYKCISKMEVDINGFTVFCPDGFYCNYNYNDTNCAPCQREACPSESHFFECTANKTEVVIKDSVEMHIFCSNGMVCNKDFLTPCSPCIEETEQQEATSTVAPSTIKTPYIPNCNDGQGSKKPCRADASKSGIYYKCRFVWSFRYVAEPHSCQDLGSDLICRNELEICPQTGLEIG